MICFVLVCALRWWCAECAVLRWAVVAPRREVQFFTTWSPRNNKKMLLEPNGEKVPLSISSILGIGSEKEMFKGDAKKGYVPSGTA